MEDLTTKNFWICGKADEAERQLRWRILQVCCEEQTEKLARQETRAVEDRRADDWRCKRKNAGFRWNMKGKRDTGLIGRTWMWMNHSDRHDDLCGAERQCWEDNPQEEQREKQWRQDTQEEQLAEARTRGREWGWQGGEKTENGKAEHRERQGNGGGGQGGREKKEKTDADEGEETVDDKMSEGSEVREMRRDSRHGPESCARCQQNPF